MEQITPTNNLATKEPDQDSDQESDGPFYLTASFWKRLVVILSIVLSAVGLVLSAIASLESHSISTLRKLTVSGIVVNALSISLSALTSLDWKKQATHDRHFAAQLKKIAHVYIDDDGRVVVTAKNVKTLAS